MCSLTLAEIQRQKEDKKRILRQSDQTESEGRLRAQPPAR